MPRSPRTRPSNQAHKRPPGDGLLLADHRLYSRGHFIGLLALKGAARVLRKGPQASASGDGSTGMQKEVALTPEGQAKLEAELIHLETVRRREVGERIKEAKEFGDISENSEYDDAKTEQAWVESRIIEVNQILANATIISVPKSTPTKVALGCKVELEDIETGDVHVYQVVGSAEADPTHDRISNESPVGQAIMGRKKGETVKVTTPRNTVIEYVIRSLKR